MKDGFIKATCITPDIRVADVEFNVKSIKAAIASARRTGAKIMVFPELCVTAYTCSDLFFQSELISAAMKGVKELAAAVKNEIVAVGMPFLYNQTLYNCAAVLNCGRVIALIPKLNIPNYSEFYEKRHFAEGSHEVRDVPFDSYTVPFGADILITSAQMKNLVIGTEICEDLWVVSPPSEKLALAGATVIMNLSCSDELTGKRAYREMLVKSQSARLFAAYLYADSGYGESTTDMVFAGDNMIAENGAMLARSEKFKNGAVFSEIDVDRLAAERIKNTSFVNIPRDGYREAEAKLTVSETKLTRFVAQQPFVPADKGDRDERCEEILTIQSEGLRKRIDHTKAKSAAVGISGGLDSTLALLVTVRACDALGKKRKDIIAVTMPCFGTTDRTYNNAVAFAGSLGVTFKEINIKETVMSHFRDIDQKANNYDVTFENAQARERTQVLMDIANKSGGLVIGTGDLSESALGWSTYNGDHMSMYAVNFGVPKTLIRYLVEYEADRTGSKLLAETLKDILATPVSPELLPPEKGKISQKTEHIVGPYELHDFFLYYMLRFGMAPEKIFRLAVYAFDGQYDKEFIRGWMKVFYRRFFAQQFKRSCVPDGPKVGSAALSPRGDWRMPSDASAALWLGSKIFG